MKDAYINANRATFEVNREMFKDVEAARLLGMGEGELEESMASRGAGAAFNFIGQGEFRPFTPSRNIINLFDDLAIKLGISNPYIEAEPIIDQLRDELESIPLGGEFPLIPNPLKTSPLPSLPGLGQTAGLPPVVGAATVNQTFANNARFGNINPVSGLTLSEEVYLDPLGKAYRINQRQQNKPTKLT